MVRFYNIYISLHAYRYFCISTYSKPCLVGFWVRFSSPNHSRALPGRHHPLKSGLNGAKLWNCFCFCVLAMLLQNGKKKCSQQISMSFIQLHSSFIPASSEHPNNGLQVFHHSLCRTSSRHESSPQALRALQTCLLQSHKMSNSAGNISNRDLICRIAPEVFIPKNIRIDTSSEGSRSGVSGVPTTPRRNPVLLAQQYCQLQKSTRHVRFAQRTQGGNKDPKPQSPYHDLVINLQLRNFWSCSPCRSGCANSSTLSWSLRLLAAWHDLACHDSVATFQKESENYPKLNISKELWIELTCNDMSSDDMYNDDMYKDRSWHLQ